MAKNNMTPEQKTRALNLHKALNVEIATDKDGNTRARKVIRRHQKYDFLGYLPLVITGAPGTPFEGFKLFFNAQAKILPGGFYLDMPQEQGKNGNYYSDVCFGSAETRAVITHKVASTPLIQSWIQECAALPKPGQEQAEVSAQAAGDENPYA